MAEVEAERLRGKISQLEKQLADLRSRPTSPDPTTLDASSGIAARGVVPDDVGAIETAGAVEESDLEEPPSTPTPRLGAPVHEQVAGQEAASGSAGNGGSSASAGGTDQALYDRGYAFFHQKRYAEAEQAFRQVLEKHPQSDLADNAQFWIGECRYARGDLSSALTAYAATVENYPDGNKVPDALFKAGKCLETLNRPAEAIEAYAEILERFPGTVVADLASERLAALRH
jgi:tol-pal system protein YbgF